MSAKPPVAARLPHDALAHLTVPIVIPYSFRMASVEDILAEMRAPPGNVRFSDVVKVCGHFFEQRKGAERSTSWLR